MATPAQEYIRNAVPTVSREEFTAAIAEISTLKQQVASLRALSGPKNVGVNGLIGAGTPLPDPTTLMRRDEYGLAYLNTLYTFVTRTTAQNVTNATWTPVEWASAPYQRGSMWVTGSNTRFTIPAWVTWPVAVDIEAGIGWDTSTTGERWIAVRKNGGNFVRRDKRASQNVTEMTISGRIICTGGDYLEVAMFQNSTTTRTIEPFADWSMRASVHVYPDPIVAGRIMPIGDSITYGSGAIPTTQINGGYRLLLAATALTADRTLQYVGTQSGNSVGMTYPNHDGHSGQDIDYIKSLVDGATMNALSPDVILLLIGANDIKNNDDLTNFPYRYDALVTAILNKWPTVRLICGTVGPYITPWGGDGSGYDMMLYQPTANDYIRLLPTNHPLGHRIIIADIAATLTTGNLPDGLHPDAAGYAQIASVWWSKLQGLL